jgi:hypothetical protein
MNIPLLASKINLSGQGLTEIPEQVFQCKNLKKLNLSNNKLKNLPAAIAKLKSLRSLDLSNNEIPVLMAKFFSLSNLETLIINNNKLKKIPKQIEQLKKLKKLSLAGNQLNELPIELNILENLKSINLANNQLSTFPAQLEIGRLREIWLNKNPITDFSALKIRENGISLKSFYSFSSMYAFSENIHQDYAKLQQKRGNALSELKILSLREQDTPQSAIPAVKQSGKCSQIFISYSHKDQEWLSEILVPLEALKYENINIKAWDDTQLQAGQVWDQEIEQSLNNADINILLVSNNFLASGYIRKKELPQILENTKQRGADIIPVIARLCRYSESPLGDYQTLNPPNSPLNKMAEHERDQVYFDLCDRISQLSRNKNKL